MKHDTHTPGPWQVQGYSTDKGRAFAFVEAIGPDFMGDERKYPQPGFTIAKVWAETIMPDELRANAHLIAKAYLLPEVERVLAELLRVADEFARRVGWTDNKPCNDARALLAKLRQ